ncbi:MAG: flavin reductase family protein [Pseudomonadota bacterium]
MSDARNLTAPGPAEFRKLMGRFATGVCVIAVEDQAGEIAAMTINSFVSVSLDPLLVCWSLHNSSSQFDVFAKAKQFSISILNADQAELALRYASRGNSGLRNEDFTRSANDRPVIEGAVGYFDCKEWANFPAGDHTMILGQVVDLSPRQIEESGVAPLGFVNGEFCSIGQ